MKNLIAFIVKYHHWFVFLILEVISAILLFQYNSYQGSVWFSSANVAAGKVYEWSSEVESFFSLTKVNEELTQRNTYLEHQVAKLSEKLSSISGDSAFMQSTQLKMLAQYKLIPAKVITNEISKPDNLITLDKGETDGVHKDMGVVSGTGVVGIVYMTSSHYSIVIPVLSSQSNISCTIEKRGYFGYLHWNGGPCSLAYMDDVPRHAHFRRGDNVVTSGYSSIFPEGIMVGKVGYVFNSADGLSYRVQVKLSTDFGRLRDVCVIADDSMKERLQLMRAAQDSTKVVR
ncbi:MAG: rod shape-determining protein MreC [Prevotella sp.]|nr:rod shape-determining protein MreC [Prevotella sp.]